MENLQNLPNFAKAFTKAQSEFNTAAKTSTNAVFGSKYADFHSVSKAIRDALTNNGLSFIQRSVDSPGNAAVSTIIIHESGEMLDCGVVSVPFQVNDSVGYGSAFTFAKRYSLEAAFGVAREDADDDGAGSTEIKTSSAKAEVNEHGLDPAEFEKRLGLWTNMAKHMDCEALVATISSKFKLNEAQRKAIAGLYEVAK